MGVTVVVRNTHGSFLHYAQSEVVRLAKGRLQVKVKVNPAHDGGLSDAGAMYYYSGKNCFLPTGKTRLVIPTEIVLKARGHPGDLGRDYQATTV